MRRPLWILLALLLAHSAIVLRHHARPLITDELYYAAKARYVATHGAFPKAGAQELELVANRAWGTSDWRPPGYPLFLVLVAGSGIHDDAALRLRVTIVQIALLIALILAVYRLVPRESKWPAALLLGLAPWPFEFANDIGPDALNAVLAGFALLLLWRRTPMFLAMLVAASTLLFRPEMIAMVPAFAIAAIALRPKRTWRDMLAAVLAFSIVAGIQIGYRTWFTGKPDLFGGLRVANAGAFNWTRTWIGTEKEAYDFVYAVTEGRLEELPGRAFSNERERALVEGTMREAHARGYSAELDARFQALADQRRREHPLLWLTVRALNVVQVWVNLETNSTLLDALTPVPRIIRRPLLGGLLVLRLLILVCAFIGAVRAWKRWRRGEADDLDRLTLLMFAYAVCRTLLVGIVLDWRVHRYVVSAWIPVIWCAIRGLSPMPGRRWLSRGPGASAGADRSADAAAASS